MCGCIAIVVSGALICCVLPVMALGIIGGLLAIASGNEITDQSTERLAISDREDVNLFVTNTTGLVSIRGEDDVSEIVVEITRKGQGLSDNRSQELVDSIVVDVRHDGGDYFVEVSGSDGNIPGIDHASADLRITVPHRLNIDASNETGAITIRDVEIVDSLMIENNLGGIEFEGKIGPEGDHEIRNDIGGVDLKLGPGQQLLPGCRCRHWGH